MELSIAEGVPSGFTNPPFLANLQTLNHDTADRDLTDTLLFESNLEDSQTILGIQSIVDSQTIQSMDLVTLNEKFAAIQQQSVVATEKSSGFLKLIYEKLSKVDSDQEQLSLEIQKLKQTVDSENVKPFIQTDLGAHINEDSKNMILQIMK
jgi:hypothetical protein